MSSFIGNNPSEYEGKYIEENAQLKDYLRWCIEIIENYPPAEPCHGGPCSPPATNCDGACMDAYYFSKTLKEIDKLIN